MWPQVQGGGESWVCPQVQGGGVMGVASGTRGRSHEYVLRYKGCRGVMGVSREGPDVWWVCLGSNLMCGGRVILGLSTRNEDVDSGMTKPMKAAISGPAPIEQAMDAESKMVEGSEVVCVCLMGLESFSVAG